MKYVKLGAGCDKTSTGSLRFTFDVGLESTKPASENVRKAVVITALVVGFLLSLWGMQATAIEPQPGDVTFFCGGAR